MTPRLTLILGRLARALFLGAVVAPLLFAMAQVVPARPDIRWAVSVPWFSGPEIGATPTEFAHGPWGHMLALANTGTGDSQAVQIVTAAEFPRRPALPSHVEVRGRDVGDYELIPTDTGGIIELGSMEPGERLEVILFHVAWMDVEAVLHGHEPVPMTQLPPHFDARLRLPRWAALSVLFLLTGMAVQVLAMRGRAASRGT